SGRHWPSWPIALLMRLERTGSRLIVMGMEPLHFNTWILSSAKYARTFSRTEPLLRAGKREGFRDLDFDSFREGTLLGVNDRESVWPPHIATTRERRQVC